MKKIPCLFVRQFAGRSAATNAGQNGKQSMSSFRKSYSVDNGGSDVKFSCGGAGCATTIVVIVALWALLFGVTVGGKHYGLSGCDSKSGVTIDK